MGQDVAIDGLSLVREKNKTWLESTGNLPNDVREVISTRFFLNVLTHHGHHYQHIKPLLTLSDDVLVGPHIYEKKKHIYLEHSE